LVAIRVSGPSSESAAEVVKSFVFEASGGGADDFAGFGVDHQQPARGAAPGVQPGLHLGARIGRRGGSGQGQEQAEAGREGGEERLSHHF